MTASVHRKRTKASVHGVHLQQSGGPCDGVLWRRGKKRGSARRVKSCGINRRAHTESESLVCKLANLRRIQP